MEEAWGTSFREGMSFQEGTQSGAEEEGTKGTGRVRVEEGIRDQTTGCLLTVSALYLERIQPVTKSDLQLLLSMQAMRLTRVLQSGR